MELSAPQRQLIPETNYRRIVGFLLVVGLHVFVIWLFLSGLAQVMIAAVKGPMRAEIVEQLREEKEAPPPPPPKFQPPPPVVVAMPDVVITESAPTQSITTTTHAPEKAPPPAPAKDIIVPPKQDPRRPITSAEEMYPAMSKRLGEEGTVTLLLTLNETGRVTEASVAETSGYDRLDDAAKKEAVRSWKFVPGTINGKPAAMQYRFRVVFKLQK